MKGRTNGCRNFEKYEKEIKTMEESWRGVNEMEKIS